MIEKESIVFGGGCFWCLEAMFQRLHGVQEVSSGYSGGHLTDPTYEQVCSGTTGHAEVVRVAFDPAQISLEQLLEVFWSVHNPTTPNRQGDDVGPQYRSIVLPASAKQREVVEATQGRLESSGLWPDRWVTEIQALETFWPAEEYHRDYFARNPEQGYCQLVIAPKVGSFGKKFGHLISQP